MRQKSFDQTFCSKAASLTSSSFTNTSLSHILPSTKFLTCHFNCFIPENIKYSNWSIRNFLVMENSQLSCFISHTAPAMIGGSSLFYQTQRQEVLYICRHLVLGNLAFCYSGCLCRRSVISGNDCASCDGRRVQESYIA